MCGRSFLAPAELQGTTVVCPGCQGLVLVPSADPLGSDSLAASSAPLAGEALRLPPVGHDATEKLAFKLAYIAVGSVGLLAVAIMLTSLFHNIAHVWSSQPAAAGRAVPAPTTSPAPAEVPAKKLPSLRGFLSENYSPLGRTPATEASKPPPEPAVAPPSPTEE